MEMTKGSPGVSCSVIPEMALEIVFSGASGPELGSLPFPVCLSSVLSRAMISSSTLEISCKRGLFLDALGLLQEDKTPDRLPDATLDCLDTDDLFGEVVDEPCVVISGSLIFVSNLCISQYSCSG